MEIIIILLAPSILSIKIHKFILNEEKKELFEELKIYLMYVLSNYLFSSLCSYAVIKPEYSLTKSLIEYRSFGIKYTLIAILSAIIIPFITCIIKNNIKIKLKKKNEK